MTNPRFTYDDIVIIDEKAEPEFHPGERAWVIAVITDRSATDFNWLPEGNIYTVEFEDGTAIDIPEDYLRASET